MPEGTLSVWSDSTDWIIAYSAEDAIKVWEKHIGESWADYGEADEWEMDDKPVYKMLCEDDPHGYSQPEDAKIYKHKDGRLWVVEATTEAWIKHTGRGFLGSTEW